MLNCDVAFTDELPRCFESITNNEAGRPWPNRIEEFSDGVVDDMLKCGYDPKFSDLRTSLSLEAQVSRSRFGKLASENRPQWSGRTLSWKNNFQNDRSDALLFSTTEVFRS